MSRKYIGVSCGFHDAGVSVVNSEGDILFAGHSERYSKQKHDKDLCPEIIDEALSHVERNETLSVHYYERPWIKAWRQFKAGQELGPFRFKSIFGSDIYKKLHDRVTETWRSAYMDGWAPTIINTHPHHKCHAAASFQTSPYDEATVVVIDAIGESDCATIWKAHYNKKGLAKYKKLWTLKYPNSIGLYYSAMTARLGLRPLDEEYILMGMAAYGEPKYVKDLEDKFGAHTDSLLFKENTHIGIDDSFLEGADEFDIAASAQAYVEQLIKIVMSKARTLNDSDNLVYGGGVALNCSANRFLGDYFKNIWIMPNPGDAGNSLGAAALGYGKKLNWKNAFLGTDIVSAYPIWSVVRALLDDKIVGVASGRAEFGPRALGTRSLLADPRGPDIKEKVNKIKKRQQFRPFAPMILEELVDQYFDMPKNWKNSPYMQVTAKCRFPDKFPAIVHEDGTSRVQTIPKDGTGIRRLVEAWYEETDCPILLNTSLNVRGEPMVNDRADADRFEKLYKTRVIS
jgi:carbamoyltransferase|tara:strand:+ start:502 stop:2040 length:1539 start_codon:yes stop_codon:yes gene_type:complete